MFNRPIKFIILFIALSSQIFLFQNCGDGFESVDNSSGYQWNTTDTGDLDIQNINTSLKQYQARLEAQPLYANRMLMYNIFSSIFGPSIRADLVKNVAWASSEMGSGYNTYEKVLLTASQCRSKRNALYRCDNFSLEQKVDPIMGASAPREGRRMSACHLGVDTNSSLAFAFKKIEKNATLAAPPQLNKANLQRVFKLFFRGRPLPNSQFFDALKIVHQDAGDSKEGWKSVILSVCLSPHWQVM